MIAAASPRRLARALFAIATLASLVTGCRPNPDPEPPPPTATAQVMFVNLSTYGGDTVRIERPGFQGSGVVYADALRRGEASGYHVVPAGAPTYMQAVQQQFEFTFEPDRRYVVTLAGRADLRMNSRELILPADTSGAAFLRFGGHSEFSNEIDIFGTAVPFSGRGIDPNAFQAVTAGDGTLRATPKEGDAQLEVSAQLKSGEYYDLMIYEERVGDSRALTEPAMMLVHYGPGE